MSILKKFINRYTNQSLIIQQLKQHHLLRSALVRGAGGVFFLDIVSRLITVIGGLIIARTLGSAGVGAINYAFAIVSLLLVLANLGFPNLLVRELSVAQSISSPGKARGLLQFGTILPLIMAFLTMTIAIYLSLPSVDVLKIPQTGQGADIIENAWLILVLAMLRIPFETLIGIRQAAMRAFGMVAQSRIPEYVVTPAINVLLLSAGWFLWGHQLAITSVIVFRLFAITIAYFYGEHLLRKKIPTNIRMTEAIYEPSKWLVGALPFIFITGMLIILNRVDIIMLGMFNNAEGVGVYSIASQLGNYILFPTTAASTALAPRFASLYTQGRKDDLQMLFTGSARMVLLVTFILGIPLILFGSSILGIYGSEFAVGDTALSIIVVSQIINVAVGLVTPLLAMTNYTWLIVLNIAITTGVNVALNLILIPTYGIEGAAFATAVSTLLWDILMIICVWRTLKIVPTAIGKYWK